MKCNLHLRLALFFLITLYKTRPAPAKNIATSGPNLPGITSLAINPNAAPPAMIPTCIQKSLLARLGSMPFSISARRSFVLEVM